MDLQSSQGYWISLPLLFDTGAAFTVLRHQLYPLLGVADWRAGLRTAVSAAGSAAESVCYRYPKQRLRLFGRAFESPIHLMELPWHPSYVGLLGREGVFEHFGFGFWEKDQRLFVTRNP